MKLCQSRQDSVACVKQTALEFREVLGRFSAELPSIPIPDGALNGFVTATTASDVALAANPLSASLRARAHVCSLEESLLHLDKMCDQLHAAIQCRRILLQRVVQVNVTISKAALAVQSHLMSRQEMEGLGETIAGSDVAAVSGDIPVGPTAAQVVDPQWLDDAAVALLDQHPT